MAHQFKSDDSSRLVSEWPRRKLYWDALRGKVKLQDRHFRNKELTIYSKSDDLTFEQMVAPAPVIPAPAQGPSPRLRQPPLRGTLPLMIEREHWARRLIVGLLVLGILAGFWLFTQQFWVPAHPGTDQNGYLVGGKMFASHFSKAMTSDDPYAFVGRMWIVTEDGRYFPKYPPAFSILAGVMKMLGGPTAAYFISPFFMLLALAGVFRIVRQIAGSFAGILGILIVATSPVALALANNPNSHAIDLCAVTWGMYLLLRWWERGSVWRAASAGALLGLAAAIRYSEALLFLPLFLSSCFNLQWRRSQSWFQVMMLIVCWAVPISLMLVSSRIATGHWTGYDLTNESAAAFSWENIQNHWFSMVRELADTGLFFTLPIGLMGLILLFARNWKLALVMWAWVLPTVLPYFAYYWYLPADHLGIGSMRFLLTVFPPLALGAAWCMTRLVPAAPYSSRLLRWVVAPLAALVIVLGAGAFNIYSALPMLENDRRKCQAVAQATDQIMNRAKAPADSVILGPQEFLNHLQFVSDYRLYDTSELDPQHILGLNDIRPDDPNALQPKRAKMLYDRLKGNRTDAEFKKQLPADLAKLLRELTLTALTQGRRVFVIVPPDAAPPLKFTDARYASQDHSTLAFEKVLNWTEERIAPGPGQARSVPLNTQTPPASWQLLEITLRK